MGLCFSKIISISDRKKSSAAASVIFSNVDILTQILLRLPVKSLLICKSVSKQWFSIISDPYFCNEYNKLQNSLSIQGLYTQTIEMKLGASAKLEYVPLDGSSSPAPFKTLSYIDDPLGIMILQSCNGLICCRSNVVIPFNVFNNILDRKYYICNPSTRQYCQIVCESQKHEIGFEKLLTVSLAYDPLKSSHFKVVCVWLVSKLSTGNFNCQIEIYSSETASWKQSGEVFSLPSRYYFGSCVFWKGSLHWIDTFNTGKFFCYNVNQELRMEMPIYDKENGMKTKILMECKGHLYLIVNLLFSHTSFEVLEMETDYTRWNMRYLVSLQELIIAYPRFRLYRSIDFDVLLVKEVEEQPPNLVLRVQDMVFSYDLRDMSFKEIQQLAPAVYRDEVAYQYVQTLACV